MGMATTSVQQQIISTLVLLHQRRWSDSLIARTLEVSPNTVARWRRGEVLPNRPAPLLKELQALLETP